MPYSVCLTYGSPHPPYYYFVYFLYVCNFQYTPALLEMPGKWQSFEPSGPSNAELMGIPIVLIQFVLCCMTKGIQYDYISIRKPN